MKLTEKQLRALIREELMNEEILTEKAKDEAKSIVDKIRARLDSLDRQLERDIEKTVDDWGGITPDGFAAALAKVLVNAAQGAHEISKMAADEVKRLKRNKR